MLKINYKKCISLILSAALSVSSLFVGNVMADTETVVMKKAQKPVTINVGKGDSFQFNSIQKALDSVLEEPTEEAPLTIVINEGVYEEEVNVKLPYVAFKAQKGKKPQDIVITYDKANGHVDDPNKAKGTQQSATVTVEPSAVGFSANGITFENSYNIGEKHSHRPQAQAVALVTMADKVVLDNCRFIGRQDTLYLKGASKGKTVFGDANSARVYVKDCYIEGTVDYIFGDATAFFDNCDLFMTERKYGGHYTAANTTLSNIGYVFSNCRVMADSCYGNEPNSVVDLGRPWQGDSTYPYYGSYTAFINCVLPNCLNSKGFVPWNDSTVKNKIRYIEYGSVNSNGELLDLSSRNDFMRILTKEQADVLTAYNVLRGDDDWNPSKSSASGDKINVLDVTLDNYSLNIPENESKKINALVLPLNASNKNLNWVSDDESIATVDDDGNVTGISTGKTNIKAITADNGFSAYATVNVTPKRTEVPVIKNIGFVSDSKSLDNITVGDTIKLDYSYENEQDNYIDNALVKWCAVNSNGDEFIITEGKKLKSYVVDNVDIGFKIKAYVYPETTTSYGDVGEVKSFSTNNFIEENDQNKSVLYLKDNFSDLNKHWNLNGNFRVYKNAEAQKQWSNILYNARMRFDPKKEGISSSDSIDIYTAFSGKNKSYYRLNIKRGSNSESLKLYLYKKDVNNDEILLVSDENSLSKKVPQNKGEENPYFFIKETINNGKIAVSFTLEGDIKPIMVMEYNDNSPLSGFTAYESTSDALLISSLTISDFYQNKDNNKIYLVGDSFDGLAEYLQNCFYKGKFDVVNYGECGQSVRSFINQGKFDNVINQLNTGDLLFIGFGFKDSKIDENSYLEYSVPLGVPDENGSYPSNQGVKSKTPKSVIDLDKNKVYSDEFYSYECGGTFKWFIKNYITKALNAGAIPILVTPPTRASIDENGNTIPAYTDGNYAKAILQIADEMNVLCIDLNDITKTIFDEQFDKFIDNVNSESDFDKLNYNYLGYKTVVDEIIETLKNSDIEAKNALI